jgi:prepilin-type N-terminal cleavage/methylation domain-containing protein
MQTNHHRNGERGFTLIEMVVSVALFAIVMVVSIGALLSLVTANRKARALESVMNNLNISLDSMVRAERMGSHYVCNGDGIPVNYDTAGADCVNGGTELSFAPYGSDASQKNERTVYFFQTDAQGIGRLYRSQNGGASSIAITAPEISIDDVNMYVIGTQPGDIIQPKVVTVIKGSAGAANAKIRTTFYIQATAVQRSLDI